jgi:pyruvate formate lyase activating enzyme
LIQGVNADENNIEATAVFIAALPGPQKAVSLLPFHDVAGSKSAKLGKQYDAGFMSAPGENDLDRIVRQFANHGLKATVGG